MSEERCEGCGSTCVCCCTCEGWDDEEDDEELEQQPCPAPVPCPPFRTTTLNITQVWFGEKYGWLTYNEAVAKGLLELGDW